MSINLNESDLTFGLLSMPIPLYEILSTILFYSTAKLTVTSVALACLTILVKES